MKNIQNKIETTTYQALLFLAGQQKRNGGFLNLTTPTKDNFEKGITHATTFFTANILHCLNQLPASSLAYSIRQKSARFLLFQKSRYWSFNYWQRGSEESRKMPYPDDLDDTFCALSALAEFDRKLITGKTLANAVKILTSAEVKPGGPYKTWLTDGSAWDDVDVAVNANIANFMSMQKTELPDLVNFFDRAIKTKQFSSAYYTEIFPVVYFISRNFKGGLAKNLTKYLLAKRQPDFSWSNPLNTALAVSALINLNFQKFKELSKSIDYLLANFDGKKWDPYAFYLDLARQGEKYFAGSASLTTAFCLEAIHKYLLLQKQVHERALKKKQFNPQEERIYRKIVSHAQKRFSTLASEAKGAALEVLEKTLAKDTDRQIMLLSFWFRQALGENGKSVTDEQVTTLGLINLYGWIAYSVYDDFFDGEGNVNFLPVANVCLREVSAGFASMFGQGNSNGKIINKILDNIESANAWEYQYCRGKVVDGKLAVPKPLPDFKNLGQLADKSLGHALGPVAIFMLLNFEHNSWQVKELISFFKNYLIARQLNDDAHDWLEDLHAGRINSVGAEVLANYNRKTINFQRDERNLQKIFWNGVLPLVARDIFKHAKAGRLALSQIGEIKKPDKLLSLLDRPETAARQALEEAKKMREFLSSY